jgi:hypothetical protein
LKVVVVVAASIAQILLPHGYIPSEEITAPDSGCEKDHTAQLRGAAGLWSRRWR